MIFESKALKHGVGTKKGVARFAPDPLKKSPFGVLDTSDRLALRKAGCKDHKELEGEIMDHNAYKDRRVGEAGVWQQLDRLSVEQKGAASEARRMAFENMEEADLRAVLKSKKVAVPQSAKKDKLVELVLESIEIPHSSD